MSDQDVQILNTEGWFQEFHKALLSAFPIPGKLKMMVRFSLNENLDAITTGENYQISVFQLILWAEANGRLKELLTAARQDNPGNPALRRFDEEVLRTPIEEKQSEQNDLSSGAVNYTRVSDLLADVINQTKDQLQEIFIFDLNAGIPLYFSSTRPKMDEIVFGDNDIGQAFEHFENLKQVSKALDSFGETTKFGSLQYSIFKLEARQLMIYFYDLPDTTVAICFIALTDVPIGRLVDLCENKIDTIKDKLLHMF
ncbi:effector-associated domain EAD1-containing protein [Scytonema sp. PCC 10023]|uniref:effector-associated domain EAD1-containing protein n=1 Tax=Scytonema sp. PCC 10023 TaxID=1680591 RepID=UPI0039C5B2EB